MSVRVNLLPGEVAERNRAARQRALAGAAGLGLVALLGAAYWFKASQVADAEAALATEQARVAELEAEAAELAEFAQLRLARQTADELLSTRFAGEVSFAGILQDLATVYPTDAELETLAIALTEPSAELGATRLAIGRVTATGLTLNGHAPGLERLLLELDKVAAFSNVYFSNSTQTDDGQEIAAFSLDLDLGDEILTRRYDAGLPEELR